jgi:hypothetical protein
MGLGFLHQYGNPGTERKFVAPSVLELFIQKLLTQLQAALKFCPQAPSKVDITLPHRIVFASKRALADLFFYRTPGY